MKKRCNIDSLFNNRVFQLQTINKSFQNPVDGTFIKKGHYI